MLTSEIALMGSVKATPIVADAESAAPNIGHRGFYSEKQVCELHTFSRATLYREIAAGRFPRQVKITRKRVGWLKDAIDAHLAELAKAAA